VNNIRKLFAGLALAALGLLSGCSANYPLNLMKGVTKVSHEIYELHMLIMWICVFIGIVVFGAMFYSIYFHRKSKGHEAAQFHENTTVEIVWTIIPILILVGMAIPATKTLIDLEDTKAPDMTIQVTGRQWYWDYKYLDNGIHFESHLDEASEKVHRTKGADPRSVANYLLNVDKPLVIPTKKKIRFVLTSKDVIHSWWVPDFGWKKDANPGFINEASTYIEKPGVFRGQCTELCGRDHGFMPIVVIAMDQPDYDAWVKKTLEDEKARKEKPDLAEQTHEQLMAHGESVYLKNCVSCHQIDGKGVKGLIPALAGSAKVNGDWMPFDGFLRAGAGKKMPAFDKLNGKDLAEVMTYVRNSFGNKAGGKGEGQEIQPNDTYIEPDE
jgi:cytochrome c oxidase subunit 2